MAKWKYFSEAEFIWNGEWNDSELEYKGQLFNCPMIEDSIYSDFNEYANEEGIEINEDNFTEFCKQNPDSIREIFEYIINRRFEDIVEKVKVDFEIVLNSFKIINHDEIAFYEKENPDNIFELDNGFVLYSDDWYDVEYDY